MNYNEISEAIDETTATPYIKKTPMDKIIEAFEARKRQPDWMTLTPAQRMDAEFTHQMNVKYQKNREIYAEKFGIYFEDEEISDEEIEYMTQELAAVSSKIDQEFDLILANQVEPIKKPRKKRVSKKHCYTQDLFA